MAFNIVDLVKDQIGDAVMDQLGGALGGSKDATSKAVDGAIPSILEGLMNKAGSADGADSIFKAVQDQDDGILSNLGDLIGGGIDSPFASMGFTVLRSLLGNSMLGNIAGAIGGFSGLGRSSSSSMLGLVAPIILGVIKRKVLGGGLNAASLASMLNGQKDNIATAMPAGFADQIRTASASTGVVDDVADTVKSGASAVTGAATSGASAVTGAATSGASAVGTAAADTASAGGGMFGKLIPLILLAAAAYFGLKMFGGNTSETTQAVVQPAEVVTETVIQPAEVVTEVVTETVTVPATEVVTEAVAPVMGAATDGISYAITQNTAAGALDSVITLNADGSGTISSAMGEIPFSGATVNGSNIAFDVMTSTAEGDVALNYTGIITGDVINGVINSAAGASEFSGSLVQ